MKAKIEHFKIRIAGKSILSRKKKKKNSRRARTKFGEESRRFGFGQSRLGRDCWMVYGRILGKW
jgi:hypothetical protein